MLQNSLKLCEHVTLEIVIISHEQRGFALSFLCRGVKGLVFIYFFFLWGCSNTFQACCDLMVLCSREPHSLAPHFQEQPLACLCVHQAGYSGAGSQRCGALVSHRPWQDPEQLWNKPMDWADHSWCMRKSCFYRCFKQKGRKGATFSGLFAATCSYYFSWPRGGHVF